MNKVLLPMLLASCALAACKPRAGGLPAPPMPPSQRDAIKALGSTIPEPDFDGGYWQKQHDTDTSQWQEAKRLCEQTVLANYPNCLPVNDIVTTDQRKRAEAGTNAASKTKEMFRRGYLYDDWRQEWLPFRDMDAAGCTTVYPTSVRPGRSTWQCPADAAIPEGIPDPSFSKEGN